MVADLLSFCHSKYRPSDDRCTGCQNNCQGGCEQCLDAIHFSRIDRDYNCPNIAYFYTCKYSYKYSSEIDILLSKLQSLKSFSAFNVISIGCGPCTELLGLYRCLSRSGYSKPLTYVAFDMNPIWKPIHAYYNTYLTPRSDFSLKFSYADACKAVPRLDLSRIDWRPNILFLQYVLSDMDKSGISVSSFLDSLLSSIISLMPTNSYIIINDINHWKARRWFEYIESRFCTNYNYWSYKGHFRNNNKQAYEYGVEHPENALTCRVSLDIVKTYSPWQFCSSAHLVLKKRGTR